MKHTFSILASAALIATVAIACTKQEEPKPWDEEPIRTDVHEEGFYKDLFMDGGIRLTHRTTLPSATTLGLEMEFLATGAEVDEIATASDTAIQIAIMSQSEEDANGVLLYPDGEPRFRMIYMNGGKSTSHATSMSEGGCEGIARIRQFYYNGGGYLGTCAGAFMTGTGYDETESFVYLRFVSFKPKHTKVSEQNMSMSVEPGCPLLQYYNFGGDNLIADIYHNGGCYANEGMCQGAVALLRYSTASHSDVAARNVNGKISSWTFKRDSISGRLCAIGSHPEGVSSGEKLDLMCAFEKYILANLGAATIKDTLFNGKEIAMTKSTSQADPAHTRIGDKQNHHFALWVPAGAKNLTITLDKVGWETYENCQLDLYGKKGNFAFISKGVDYAVINDNAHKEISIPNPEKGLYYFCVNCPTTVSSEKVSYSNEKSKTGYYYKYTGNTEVLNGVPYTIKATWEE